MLHQNSSLGEIWKVNHTRAPTLSYPDTSSWDSWCWNTSIRDETQVNVSATLNLKLGLPGLMEVFRSQDSLLFIIVALVCFKILFGSSAECRKILKPCYFCGSKTLFLSPFCICQLVYGRVVPKPYMQLASWRASTDFSSPSLLLCHLEAGDSTGSPPTLLLMLLKRHRVC